jgi:hypothetical protein
MISRQRVGTAEYVDDEADVNVKPTGASVARDVDFVTVKVFFASIQSA